MTKMDTDELGMNDEDRRPHWSDDLIEAVDSALWDETPAPEYVYRIIATVEDWMDANDNPLPHVLNECLQWLDAERAAIQRVRELHSPRPNAVVTCDGCDGKQHWPCETIRAIEEER